MNQQQIEEKIKEFQETFLPSDWQWRKGQKEAIIEIILTYYNKTQNVVILHSPVGVGKSIVAMCASWILNQERKEGYILASDIALQDQYEKDFKKFNLNYGVIKGLDHYKCIDNDEKNSLGTCRIRNKRPRSMYCYEECPYYSARDHASVAPTSLLNYSYWLIHMNYVNQSLDEDDQIFKQRDFTFCDEAHKLLDIVQNHYSPRFDPKTLEKLEKLTQFFATYKVRNHINDFSSIKQNVKKLFQTENQEVLHNILKNIELSFESYRSSWELLKEKVKNEYPHDDPPKEWREALWLCDWLKDLHCKIEDYNDIISKTSIRNLVKNPTKDDELTFNCLEESYMMHKYFHTWTGFTVLMSATFADPKDYLRSIALNNAKYIKSESLFNYEKSPIYFYNKHRMSYNQIKENLPWLYSKINEIMEQHKFESGIIHTASYDLTLKIYQNIDKKYRKRLLVYNGTEEKREALQELKLKKGMVLLGPSLLDGLNLKDEWSRFCVFAKVPYLSLTDKFVATKLKIDSRWYQWKAIVNILQGTGRSIRSENDYASTYILDACFSDLLHFNRSSFPLEFLQRILVIGE
jgi:ATP-dependent DNA helicase DinG